MLASVASMIDQFNMENIKILQNQGYEVHVAANFEFGNTSSVERVQEFKRELETLNVKVFQVEFSRKIGNLKANLKAFRDVKNLMKKNQYKFAHCHSPIGGVIGRIAGRVAKTPIIYTAHGFHFYKGSPIKNWLIYYPIERWLSKYTDILITINQEDYEIAKKFKSTHCIFVPGIGIDTKKFSAIEVDKSAKLKELGISEDKIILLSVGELIRRKNHETAIKAIATIPDINIIYLICGRGDLDKHLIELTKSLGLTNRVRFLGFRRDIPELCRIADCFIFPSYQEGLPVAVMEAMAAGLPIICSRIRGNVDLIIENESGYLVGPDDYVAIAGKISHLVNNPLKMIEMGIVNANESKKYDKMNINSIMVNVYESLN
jgi:glycosyltransferase involved in cell wall biosynthesis